MKKAVSLLLSITFILFTMSMVASAQTFGVYDIHEAVAASEDSAQPRYIPCPVGGKHFMRLVGLCSVRGSSVSSPVVFTGTTTQCVNCKMYMAVQYFPGANRPYIGNYNISDPVSGLDLATTFLGGSHGAYWELQEDSFIQGFEWAGYS